MICTNFYSDLMEVIVLICIVGGILLAGYMVIDFIRSEDDDERMEAMIKKEKH